MSTLSAILAEPPLRRAVQAVLAKTPGHWRAKARFDAVGRPQYLVGCFYAADQAKREGYDSVAVIEFGVAEGQGLLELEDYAAAVGREVGIGVAVYGFDGGAGLPQGTGDYRDHPDVWAPGDYAMPLRPRLSHRTALVIGDVRETVMTQAIQEPIGFVAMDLDFYSSTVDALRLFDRVDVRRLRRVAMYFDDVMEHYNHRAAGELLAIDEFNDKHAGEMLIDHWRGLGRGRPFHEAYWLAAMYLAHDLAAISRARLTRPAAKMR